MEECDRPSELLGSEPERQSPASRLPRFAAGDLFAEDWHALSTR